jgi:hypothetical protein
VIAVPTPDTLDQIVATLDYWLAAKGIRRPGDVALLGGSLAAGLGNRTSDIDVYLVRDTAPPNVDGRQFFLLQRRVDVHDLTRAELAEAVAVLESAGPDVPGDRMTLVYRVLNGRPIGAARLTGTLVERGNAALRAALIRQCEARVGQTWQRLWRAVETDDPDGYQLATVDLVEDVLYGGLAVLGSTYPNRKWNGEKLRQLADPSVLLGPLSTLRGLVREAWPACPDPEPVNTVLRSVGLTVDLAVEPWRPVRAAALFLEKLASNSYLVLGDEAYLVGSGTGLIMSLCDGTRTVAEISRAVHDEIGTSAYRVGAAVRALLWHALELGLLSTFPVDLSPLPNDVEHTSVFEPSITPVGDVGKFLRSRFAMWSSWVEYLSHRDDFDGALDACQTGAAVTAAREIYRDVARIYLSGNGQPVAELSEMAGFRELFGVESSNYRNLLDIVNLCSLDQPRADELRDHVEAVCDGILGNPTYVVGGGLRDEHGHNELFHYVRELLHFADACGVNLHESPLIRQKSDLYGTVGS